MDNTWKLYAVWAQTATKDTWTWSSGYHMCAEGSARGRGTHCLTGWDWGWAAYCLPVGTLGMMQTVWWRPEWIKELQFASLLPNKPRLPMKLLNQAWQQNARLSAIVSIHKVLTHIKSITWELRLQLKDCIIGKYRGQWGRRRGGRKGREKSPIPTKL